MGTKRTATPGVLGNAVCFDTSSAAKPFARSRPFDLVPLPSPFFSARAESQLRVSSPRSAVAGRLSWTKRSPGHDPPRLAPPQPPVRSERAEPQRRASWPLPAEAAHLPSVKFSGRRCLSTPARFQPAFRWDRTGPQREEPRATAPGASSPYATKRSPGRVLPRPAPRPPSPSTGWAELPREESAGKAVSGAGTFSAETFAWSRPSAGAFQRSLVPTRPAVRPREESQTKPPRPRQDLPRRNVRLIVLVRGVLLRNRRFRGDRRCGHARSRGQSRRYRHGPSPVQHSPGHARPQRAHSAIAGSEAAGGVATRGAAGKADGIGMTFAGATFAWLRSSAACFLAITATEGSGSAATRGTVGEAGCGRTSATAAGCLIGATGGA